MGNRVSSPHGFLPDNSAGGSTRTIVPASILSCALPPGVRRLAATAAYSLSSDLPRAVESLRALAPGRTAPAEVIFCEAGLPRLPAIPVRLDSQFLAILARVGWFLVWSRATKSALGVRRHARAACQQLLALSAAHGSVLLVGHAIFIAFIAWEPRSSGWRGPLWPTGRYWPAAVYRKGPT